MGQRPRQRRKIPALHYAAMGRVADTWADLEFAIDHIIWRLMRTDQAFGACVTSQMISIHPRSKALLSLLSLYEISQGLEKDIVQLMGQCAGHSDMRNRLIHDKRLLHGSSGEVIRFEVSAKKNLIFGSQPESIASLDKFTGDIENLINKLDLLSDRLWAELDTSRGKLRGKLPQLTRWSTGAKVRPAGHKTPIRRPPTSQR